MFKVKTIVKMTILLVANIKQVMHIKTASSKVQLLYLCTMLLKS